MPTLLLACQQYAEIPDHGRVCVSSEESNGRYRLVVEANSGDCAADHVDATYECSITVDGTEVRMETFFQDGKDPNSACAGPLLARCEAELDAGIYNFRFADEYREMIAVPFDSNDYCFSGGGASEG